MSEDEARSGGARRRQQGGNGMVRVLIGVIVLLLVVAAGLGFLFFSGAISTAQPTAGAATAPVPTPTPRPATAGGGATAAGGAAGAAAGQPPAQAAQPIITKEVMYGDWKYTCGKANAQQAVANCEIVQTLSNAQSKRLAFVWQVVATEKGLVAEWLTQTNVAVSPGLIVDLGGAKPYTFGYNYCTTAFCQVQVDVPPDLLDAFSKATKANVTIFPLNSKGLTFQFSPKGLGDALTALKAPPT